MSLGRIRYGYAVPTAHGMIFIKDTWYRGQIRSMNNNKSFFRRNERRLKQGF